MLLLRIERFLRATKTTPTRFGRDAANDPWLVDDLRRGRTLRPATAKRIAAHLDRVEAELQAELRP